MNIVTDTKMSVVARVGVVVALLLGTTLGASVGAAYATVPFGIESFESAFLNEGGLPVEQAGSHPYALTMKTVFDHETLAEGFEEKISENPRDVIVKLPAGVVVNPMASGARCTEGELETNRCPNASAVGIAIAYLSELGAQPAPIYNMVRPPGAPAELAFEPAGSQIFTHVVGKVRTGSDYGLSADVSEITQKISIYGFETILWGSPTSPRHDAERGSCGRRNKERKEGEEETFREETKEAISEGRPLPNESEYLFSCPVERQTTPFLTMPGSCSGESLKTEVTVDTWQDPGALPFTRSASTPPITGCGHLSFTPALTVTPEPASVSTESPSGLSVDLKVPQEENVAGLAEADLKDATVMLPRGVAVSPSAANGLGACTSVEISLHNADKPSCPASSKIGEAEVVTPLLENPLKGGVYLAQQETFEGSLIGLYLVAEGSGVVIKLGGKVTLDDKTGQIATTFDNNPQLPFSDLKLEFFGGPRAALVTPASCGTYATTSRLVPWSGGVAAEPSSAFPVSQGCGAGGFAPAFTAGTGNNQAGAFSPFSMTLSRHDGEQRLSGVQVTTPPGLLGTLKSVLRCPEPQAEEEKCGPESLIGETTVAAGPGEDPYWVKGGKVYLTGPYAGAPFGLSIVVPAMAGPFDLGYVRVRAQVKIDPNTAQITVVSNPLPTILKGIPLDVRTIHVTIDRPGFMFNPTNCSPLGVGGMVESTSGTNSSVSSPFQAANCAALPFKPSFKSSTQAKTSKAKGASLTVKVGSSTGQANIAKVRVILPKQLPARLTTLQKACTEAQFNANPAGCPPGADVGSATAVTPVLAHPLTGPAYLVSHGGAAFPDVVFVLQGEGIVLYLDGNTNIKKGITSSTFNSVPDAPISTFETVFPEGPHSVLATDLPAKAKGSMCTQKLTMPTVLTGQNGAVVTQTTKIAVTGCPKAKKAGGKAGKASKRRQGGRGRTR